MEFILGCALWPAAFERIELAFWLQFLKQMYVLVLGLDVLGNPFGLIRGLSEGVEAFFYEPFQVRRPGNCRVEMIQKPMNKGVCVCQGAVQGPEEFAEGFVIGVRSLLGHTVGKKLWGDTDEMSYDLPKSVAFKKGKGLF